MLRGEESARHASLRSNAVDAGQSATETTRGAKTADSADSLLQLLDDNDLRGIYLAKMSAKCDFHCEHLTQVYTYPLNNQLRNSLALLDLEVDLAEVEQQHLQWASVVRINHTSTHINAVLARKSAARGDAAVRPCRDGDRNVRVD